MNYKTEFINKAKTYVITTVSRNITMPAPYTSSRKDKLIAQCKNILYTCSM